MDRITEFVDSFIPKNLPKKRKSQLREELICHILDKADYYMDLGYKKDDSFTKAIEDFGTDKEMKNHILGEFEELYRERTIWGILAGIFIYVMNWMCYPMDIWVASADYNRDPDPAGAFVSFCMIYTVLGLIMFARIKKYRKMLLCLGISNLLIVGIVLWFFYPQMAMYSLMYNIIYLVDRFTPFLLGNTMVDGFLYILFMPVLFIGISVYCFVASFRLKKGKTGSIKNEKRKCIIAGTICIVVMIVTCLLQPTGQKYYDNYPLWFSPYDVYISEETEEFYDKINIGDSLESADALLKSEGFQTIEEYVNGLDKLTKKQFKANINEFNFVDGFTVYVFPDKYIKGAGFVGIKEDKGIVTGVAIGNLGKHMYDSEGGTFGYYNHYFDNDYYADIYSVKESFFSLNLGDRESDVMSISGLGAGDIYTKRKYVENGNEKTYYRIHFYGAVNAEKDYRSCYVELLFSDGTLENGTMYTYSFEGDKKVIYADQMNK